MFYAQKKELPYEVQRLDLVEAFGMSPFFIEQVSFIGTLWFLGLDIEPTLT